MTDDEKIKAIVEQGLWGKVTTLPEFSAEHRTARPKATRALNLIIKARDDFAHLNNQERARLVWFYDQLKKANPELGLA